MIWYTYKIIAGPLMLEERLLEKKMADTRAWSGNAGRELRTLY
jgi:hypothetical protein